MSRLKLTVTQCRPNDVSPRNPSYEKGSAPLKRTICCELRPSTLAFTTSEVSVESDQSVPGAARLSVRIPSPALGASAAGAQPAAGTPTPGASAPGAVGP